MSDINKKKMELMHLIKALELAGVDHYSVEDKVGESPDFLIDIAGVQTGVEVTSIYRALDQGSAAKAKSDISVITKGAV